MKPSVDIAQDSLYSKYCYIFVVSRTELCQAHDILRVFISYLPITSFFNAKFHIFVDLVSVDIQSCTLQKLYNHVKFVEPPKGRRHNLKTGKFGDNVQIRLDSPPPTI